MPFPTVDQTLSEILQHQTSFVGGEYGQQDLELVAAGWSSGPAGKLCNLLNPQSLGLADQTVGGSNPRDGVSSRCSVPVPANLAV